jgi:hypothetical protein
VSILPDGKPCDDQSFARQLTGLNGRQATWVFDKGAVSSLGARFFTPPLLIPELQIEQQDWSS